MPDPVSGHAAQARGGRSHRPVQLDERFILAALAREREDLIAARDPLLRERSIVVQQPLILRVGDQGVAVLLEETGELCLVRVEQCFGPADLGRVLRQDVAAYVDAQFGKASRDISDGRYARNLLLVCVAHALLDLYQVTPDKDAKRYEDQQRNGQEDDQTSGDRHQRVTSPAADPIAASTPGANAKMRSNCVTANTCRTWG